MENLEITVKVQKRKVDGRAQKYHVALMQGEIICQPERDIRTFAFSLASEIFSIIKREKAHITLTCSIERKKYRYFISNEVKEKDDLFWIDIFSSVNNPNPVGDGKIFFDWFTGKKRPKD